MAGCFPICEGVLLIKADTTLYNLRRFCIECKQRWRITPILIFMHKDEWHWLYGEPDADEKESLSNSEYRKVAREVDDIAFGRYEQQRRGNSIKL